MTTKKIFLFGGIAMVLSASIVQATPDGMPPGNFGGWNPAILGPGAHGAYEMQLMRDRKQREMMTEDFKLFQRKKELEKKKGSESVVNDEDIDLESDASVNDFEKKVRDKSLTNPDFVQRNGKIMIRESGKSDGSAKEIKIRGAASEEVKNETSEQKIVPAVDLVPAQKIDNADNSKPVASDDGVADVEKAVPAVDEKTIKDEYNAPVIKEDSLSSTSSIKQAKAKPWLEDISPDAPVISSDSLEDTIGD